MEKHENEIKEQRTATATQLKLSLSFRKRDIRHCGVFEVKVK